MQSVTRERRRDQRVRRELRVDLGAIFGTTRNVSASGMFFETDVPMAIGCEVSFQVVLETPEGGRLLRCRGEVVRVRPEAGRMGMAVKILESTIEER